MALSGLAIYKLLPKTNCKKCGSPTCLAFAMKLATKKASLSDCPDVSDQAKAALDSASAPPIRKVTIGTGDTKLDTGAETVLYRHEKTFYHPAGVAVTLDDSLDEAGLDAAIDKFNKLQFERVGEHIGINLIAVTNKSGDNAKFAAVVKKAVEKSSLNLILISEDLTALEEALKISADKKPLVYAAKTDNVEKIADLVTQHSVPVAAYGKDLTELEQVVRTLTDKGVKDIVIDPGTRNILDSLNDFTQLRRAALKKNFRLLGCPIIAFTSADDLYHQLAEATGYMAKYASIIVLSTDKPEAILPLLTVRQNIYTDPQKPVTVEAKLYEIGNVDKSSPLIVTTNFSLTYYSVSPEVESSGIGCYILVVDSEGMSVLTAWAAEKFTTEQITEALKTFNMEEKVAHKTVIIPGYVAVMSGKLEDDSGWKVLVGPKEASGLQKFLKENASLMKV